MSSYKKLTITVDPEVYEGLYKKIGPRKISRFINKLARPYVVEEEIRKGYEAMAKDEAYEKEASEWVENTLIKLEDETW